MTRSFTVEGMPLNIMTLLYILAHERNQKITMSNSDWSFSFPIEIENAVNDEDEEEKKDENESPYTITIELHEITVNQRYLVSVTRNRWSVHSFKILNEIYEH